MVNVLMWFEIEDDGTVVAKLGGAVDLYDGILYSSVTRCASDVAKKLGVTEKDIRLFFEHDGDEFYLRVEGKRPATKGEIKLHKARIKDKRLYRLQQRLAAAQKELDDYAKTTG